MEQSRRELASDRWALVTGETQLLEQQFVRELIDEGLSAAPFGFLGENVVESLPKSPKSGLCQLCGQFEVLTKEHIPTRGSGNKERYSTHSLENWIDNDSLDISERGKIHQGGIYGYTLCETCNSLTGRLYGDEYKAAHNEVWTLTLGSQESGGVMPGAFVRQVLSMMCSLSGSWNLAGAHPEVRRIILEQSTEPLATELRLGACLYFGPLLRITGPQLWLKPKQLQWRWIMEVAYPPFAFLLELASNATEFEIGHDMSNWVQYESSERKIFEGEFDVGFGWTPYPGEYRTRAALEGDPFLIQDEIT
jgi:hypothetical protein